MTANATPERLRELADASVFTLYQQLGSSPRGLTESEAADRLVGFGANESAEAAAPGMTAQLLVALRSPFVALLAGLGAVFVAVGDARGSTTVAVMVTLAVVLRFWQQTRTTRATQALQRLVTATVTVRRRADAESDPMDREIPAPDLVPGDMVVLQAGDVVAADLRVLTSSALTVDQSALSGEALPVAKHTPGSDAATPERAAATVMDNPGLCLSGTAVVTGRATGVVIATGDHTYRGSLARSAAAPRPESSFDRGVRSVGWTLIRFMLVMAPIVFIVNGLVSGVWAQAAMFALAVAVGLTPEMLPVIVTTNLARGAARLAAQRVLVRRLNAIQDLGAMEVLCVDKTGTLTEDRIAYAHSIDVTGRFDEAVTDFAFIAAHFQDGPANQLDDAIVDQLAAGDAAVITEATCEKVDEIAFDHRRRRSTVVVSRQPGEHLLICKGDPDEVLPLCTEARLGEQVAWFGHELRTEAEELLEAYRRRGMRVLAIAAKTGPARWERYDESDERSLVLVGFVGFVDPTRDSAERAVARLTEHGVAVKILSGDNRIVAQQVAAQVGVDSDPLILGRHLEGLSDAQIRAVVNEANVFAELAPDHKTRIVAALRDNGHAVGFLGDGVNDVAALRVADVGVAADNAAQAAKQAADLILLDKDLAVVAAGVVEGRRTLANTMKYVKITASSNFGNVLSVLAASVFLPFLPILPIQLMVQNLLYDLAQLSVPWDRVDRDYLRKPRRWHSAGLIRFMITFGTLSTVFDLATFAALWWVFQAADSPAVFQTGWFMAGLLTQLLVVLVLRTRAVPWRGQRPARVVVTAAVVVAALGMLLPVSPLAGPLQMSAPPPAYLLWLLLVALTYGGAAQWLKQRYLRHHPAWL
ncbi:magnesium-translocating P-type ATPase [Mycobacterium sp. SMC-4]|uniref:magnesium-translocating P-type ATPase n=1 Tax=Mycobacterium sp. SMC-4 TaxID=2857059 RepID=UPI0021B3B2CD|nr:magnesium-translocating P-type ATPase [Mycobacterium sp. SMC-4]UXA19178.1 magnesium-translocating P-type ATPase [Mycobacterium sp. SMC-4]